MAFNLITLFIPIKMHFYMCLILQGDVDQWIGSDSPLVQHFYKQHYYGVHEISIIFSQFECGNFGKHIVTSNSNNISLFLVSCFPNIEQVLHYRAVRLSNCLTIDYLYASINIAQTIESEEEIANLILFCGC